MPAPSPNAAKAIPLDTSAAAASPAIRRVMVDCPFRGDGLFVSESLHQIAWEILGNAQNFALPGPLGRSDYIQLLT